MPFQIKCHAQLELIVFVFHIIIYYFLLSISMLLLLLQMAEYRISIYGRKQSEWDQLASWIVNNELYSENVVWLIQVLIRVYLILLFVFVPEFILFRIHTVTCTKSTDDFRGPHRFWKAWKSLHYMLKENCRLHRWEKIIIDFFVKEIVYSLSHTVGNLAQSYW